jgi:glycine/D-amino acid oxidase-like deaminating enzyme
MPSAGRPPTPPASERTMQIDRRQFLKTAGVGGAAVAWFGGAHLVLRSDRWEPNRSFWVSRGRAPVSPPLRGEAEVDLAIIGGGVTGLSTAVHALLRQPRRKVALLEARYVGFGATGRSGGVLGNGTEMGTPEGTGDNVDLVMSLVDRFGLSCDLERAPETQLDPYRYAGGLATAARGLGAAIYEGTRVGAIRHGPKVELAGDGFTLRAERVVVAANGYMPRLGVAADRIVPVHTAAAVTGPLPDDVLRQVPDSIFVNTSPEMYLWGRKAPGGRVLVGGEAVYYYDNGLDHRDDPLLAGALHRCMARNFPSLARYPFEEVWTGPMGSTSDQEPILGTIGEGGNVLYGGAYAGHGIAMGTKNGSFLAGMLDGEAPPAWLLRRTVRFPLEPLRYVAVNLVINMMNLGLFHMPKHA